MAFVNEARKSCIDGHLFPESQINQLICSIQEKGGWTHEVVQQMVAAAPYCWRVNAAAALQGQGVVPETWRQELALGRNPFLRGVWRRLSPSINPCRDNPAANVCVKSLIFREFLGSSTFSSGYETHSRTEYDSSSLESTSSEALTPTRTVLKRSFSRQCPIPECKVKTRNLDRHTRVHLPPCFRCRKSNAVQTAAACVRLLAKWLVGTTDIDQLVKWINTKHILDGRNICINKRDQDHICHASSILGWSLPEQILPLDSPILLLLRIPFLYVMADLTENQRHRIKMYRGATEDTADKISVKSSRTLTSDQLRSSRPNQQQPSLNVSELSHMGISPSGEDSPAKDTVKPRNVYGTSHGVQKLPAENITEIKKVYYCQTSENLMDSSEQVLNSPVFLLQTDPEKSATVNIFPQNLTQDLASCSKDPSPAIGPDRDACVSSTSMLCCPVTRSPDSVACDGSAGPVTQSPDPVACDDSEDTIVLGDNCCTTPEGNGYPMVDAHFHLDQLAIVLGRPWNSTLNDLNAYVPYKVSQLHGSFYLLGGVANFCDPEHYPMRSTVRCLAATGIAVALGAHPKGAVEINSATVEKLAHSWQWQEVQGCGGIGLDLSVPECRWADQQCLLSKLLKFIPLDKVVIVHARGRDHSPQSQEEALCWILEMFREKLPQKQTIQLHNFESGSSVVKDWLNTFPNTYFSISPLRVGKADALAKLLNPIPLNRLLVETGSPYFPGSQDCPYHPVWLEGVIRHIAEALDMKTEAVALLTTENACCLYRFKTV